MMTMMTMMTAVGRTASEVTMLHGEMRQNDRDWVLCHAEHDMTRWRSKFLFGSGISLSLTQIYADICRCYMRLYASYIILRY